MVAIPTLEEEDARRPCRRARKPDRGTPADYQSHESGADPSCHPRLHAGTAQGATASCGAACAEGVPIPPNVPNELRRDMARLAWVRGEINAIEQARFERLVKSSKISIKPSEIIRWIDRLKNHIMLVMNDHS